MAEFRNSFDLEAIKPGNYPISALPYQSDHRIFTQGL